MRNSRFPIRPRPVEFTIYLIDGIRVTQRIWLARQLFGEYPGARFTSYIHRVYPSR